MFCVSIFSYNNSCAHVSYEFRFDWISYLGVGGIRLGDETKRESRVSVRRSQETMILVYTRVSMHLGLSHSLVVSAMSDQRSIDSTSIFGMSLRVILFFSFTFW